MTGTPVRVDAREGQALFELIGEIVGLFTAEMSEMNALRLRGRLQEFGFQFINHRLPQLRRFIFPFNVPTDVAKTLNMPGKSMVLKEKVRIEHALRELYMMKERVVFNAESAVLPEEDATPVLEPGTSPSRSWHRLRCFALHPATTHSSGLDMNR